MARKAGELCGRSATADIVDAVVVEAAGRRGDDIYTSDIADIGRLADYITAAVALIQVGG